MAVAMSSLSPASFPRNSACRNWVSKGRNVWYVLLVIFSLSVLLAAGSDDDPGAAGGADGSDTPESPEPTDDERFPLRESRFWIYNGVLQANPERCYTNFVISPFSILGMFRALEVGAGGETLAQMRLFFNEETSQVVPPVLQQPAVFKYAEKLYLNIDEADERLIEYRSRIADLGGEVAPFDFPDRASAVADINHYVSQRTDGLIESIVSRQDFPTIPLITAVNAAILKAQWKTPFSTVLEDVFFGLTPEREQVAQRVLFMRETFTASEIYYAYAEDKGTTIRIPLADRRLGMFIMMPENYEELSADLERLHRHLDYLLESLYTLQEHPNRHIRVSMPKFHIHPDSCKVDVLPAMEAIGITHLTHNADFSRMTERPEVNVDMWVHEAGITADEAGIVATGASAGRVLGSESGALPPLDLTFDHPFYFAVMYHPYWGRLDYQRDSVFLFSGHLVDAAGAQTGLAPSDRR